MGGTVKVPKHLSGLLNVTENGETYMNGKIVCECGCSAFGIRYFGEQYPPSCVGIQAVDGRYALIIKAKCRDCGKEYRLFDYAKHSYDGLICGDGVSVPDEELITAVADDERYFEIEMSVEFDDVEQFTEEVVENPPEDMSFLPDDRFDIWSWLVIDLKCAKSGRKLKDFVNIELS
ncbi:MAG: hypothetical protein K2N56_07860, partial [Oscillospiraceae bacterium]|nr:hypothetical protein [Oscillospiraceae bacterium]